MLLKNKQALIKCLISRTRDRINFYKFFTRVPLIHFSARNLSLLRKVFVLNPANSLNVLLTNCYISVLVYLKPGVTNEELSSLSLSLETNLAGVNPENSLNSLIK